MEDILGGWSASDRFDSFLADWKAILDRRVNEAIATLSTIDGLRGLVLAGSIGRGEPWPLSDIDFLTILDDDKVETSRAEIERRAVNLQLRWHREGWWTGLDIGKLAFGRNAIARALDMDESQKLGLLRDDRWYHSLDKGYLGRSVFDAGSRSDEFVNLLTELRFNRSIVVCRLMRERNEIENAHQQLRDSVETGNLLTATRAAQHAGRWLMILLLEQWGKRDASLARVGTHFERTARMQLRPELAEKVNRFLSLDDRSIENRLKIAPAWVSEWNERSWRARRLVGEIVTSNQNARDSIRVATHFELRKIVHGPVPKWLVPLASRLEIEEKSKYLEHLMDMTFPSI